MSKFFVLAHNIRSAHNVGAIFRSADGFGVDHLYLTGYTAAPTEDKVVKVSLGAEKSISWTKVYSPVRLVKKLRAEYPDLTVLALENNAPGRKSLPLPNFKTKWPVLLVLGEERKGIPKSLLLHCDQLVEIPMLGHKESLNVSVACGVALYALRFAKVS